MRFVVMAFALWGLVLAQLRLHPPAPLEAAQSVGHDTVDASAHVFELIRAWHPDSGRAYCVTSMAAWPNYVYIRHVRRIFEVGAISCELSDSPLFMQLGNCPDSISVRGPPPPWVLVQCGLHRYRRYHRGLPRAPASDATRISVT